MILRVLKEGIFDGVFSEELIKELCPDSEMIKFTHTNITTEKGQFLLVNFLNNSNIVLSAKLNKTDISNFIKELSYCENNDTILNIKLSESSSWFIDFAIASMTKKDVDKLMKRKVEKMKNMEKMLIKIEDSNGITFKQVTEEELKEETKGLLSISASGMWGGEKHITLVMINSKNINRSLVDCFLDNITKKYLIGKYGFSNEELDKYTNKEKETEKVECVDIFTGN